MGTTRYNTKDATSIFAYSKGLLHKSLAEAVKEINPLIDVNEIDFKGKGGLGQLVEKFYYCYEPNSSPLPDFPEAGVELKTTPLKKDAKENYLIKERLVCDMIDFCEIVKYSFEESPFYKKSLLMLIIFYLHVKGKPLRDLEFIYSVLWMLKDKDLVIIKHDYEVIINKIKQGKAHELSEGDTMYLAACRKGQKDDSLREQPFSSVKAPKRAFSLKPAYMRTILDFVKNSKSDMATNTDVDIRYLELVNKEDLKNESFENILTDRILKFKNWDYKQIARYFNMQITSKEKSKYARVVKRILSDKLNNFEDAEEIRKAGIIVKTIRVKSNGHIKESMSFENINYNEFLEIDDWINSRWYEIITSRFMFVVFKEDETPSPEWKDEKRFILDTVLFWTMPEKDIQTAEQYWNNIKANVISDTLEDSDNTFWTLADNKFFHVRPKAQNMFQKCLSPVSGKKVPKKAYWFNNKYIEKIIEKSSN